MKSKLIRSIKGESTNRIEQSSQCDMRHYVAKAQISKTDLMR